MYSALTEIGDEAGCGGQWYRDADVRPCRVEAELFMLAVRGQCSTLTWLSDVALSDLLFTLQRHRKLSR